jgi:hypothetical protein
MMKTTRQEILDAFQEMSQYYPDMRFGQMVSNIAFWTTGPKPEAVWDVEDIEFLKTLKKHLDKKRVEKNQ